VNDDQCDFDCGREATDELGGFQFCRDHFFVALQIDVASRDDRAVA
jgi:hypothetical protein